MPSRPFYRILPYLACLLACVAVDLFYFPLATSFPDEERYLASAARLAADGQFWVAGDRAWEMPGTALFIAPAAKLFSPQAALIAVRLVQALLVAVQCALIAFMAGQLFRDRTAAFVASCMAAFYPFLWFYQGLLLSETLFNTFLLGGMAALLWWRERGLRFDAAFAAACLCFALATLTKATLTMLPPLLLAATAWCAGASLKRALAVLAVALGLYSAFMSPWWIRNATLFNAFVPFTTGSAQNLYLGNNPFNREGGIDWSRDADPAFVAKVSALPDERARQRAYADAALTYIKENPRAFIAGAVKKFVRLWNLVPNAAEFRNGFYLLISLASYGPILLLALIGAARRWRQWRGLAPLYLVIGYFTAVHVVTIASLRYRLPIEPLLIVLAAEPMAAAIETLRRRTRSKPPAGTK